MYHPGAALHEVVLRVPCVRQRHLVRLLTSGVPEALLNAEPRIYRFPAADEACALLPDQAQLLWRVADHPEYLPEKWDDLTAER